MPISFFTNIINQTVKNFTVNKKNERDENLPKQNFQDRVTLSYFSQRNTQENKFLCFLKDILSAIVGFFSPEQARGNPQYEMRCGKFTAYTNHESLMEGGVKTALSTPQYPVLVDRRTIAADPTIYPYGSIVYVQGFGYGVVADCGEAILGPDRFDLAFPNVEPRKLYELWGNREDWPYAVVFTPTDRSTAIRIIRELGVEGYLKYMAENLGLDLDLELNINENNL